MKNSLKNSGFVLFCFLIFFNGVRRHDVEESEYLKLAAQKQFDCVGKVMNDKGVLIGSCVLIHERFILSAAHVFMEASYRDDSRKVDGAEVKLKQLTSVRPMDASKVSFVFNGTSYGAKTLKVFPTYLDSTSKKYCDLVLIELWEKVPAIVPARLGTSFNELNSDVTGVGYGASGPANEPQNVKGFGKKIAGENIIDSLSGYVLNGKATLLMADFDHPTDKTCNRMGSATPKPMEFMVAGGDSGGALFMNTNNGFELIGITSGGGVEIPRLMKTGYYGHIMAWTRVSVFNDWINAGMKTR
jgi:hypothetical protein